MSNGLATVMSTLATTFTAGMAANLSTVPYVFDNGKALATAPDPRTTSWVRYSFRPASQRVASLGRVMFRLFGLLDLQIFTPLGLGIGRGITISQTLQSIFRDAPVSGVFIKESAFQAIGETDGWYQCQLRIQFTADELL